MLITTMLTLVLVVMLVSAIVYSNIGGLRLTSTFRAREEATMAAQSGLQYAVSRLENDITWKGTEKEASGSSIQGGLQVVENDGNVVGMILTPDGSKSFFRFKFNYEDGENGFDGLPDSESPIPTPWVSVNNLYNSVPAWVYNADPQTGRLVTEEYRDEWGKVRQRPLSQASYQIPKATCCLLVEGFSGNGLRDWDTGQIASLNLKEGLPAGVAHRVLEVYLGIDNEEGLIDSVACAAGDLDIDSPYVVIDHAKGAISPNMRSLANVNLQTQTLNFDKGTIYYGDSYALNGSTSLPSDATYKVQRSTARDNFTKIKWEEVRKAGQEGRKYVNMPGGTYVWTLRDAQNPQAGYELLHYDKYYPADQAIPQEAKGNVYRGLKGAVEVDTKKATISILQDVKLGDESFILRTDGNSEVSRPILTFLRDKATDSYPVMSSERDIYIQGATLGGGSITSAGSISLQGPSILESDPGIGVSIYAKGDVTLLPIESYSHNVKEEAQNRPNNSNNPSSTNPDDYAFTVEAQTELDDLQESMKARFYDVYRNDGGTGQNQNIYAAFNVLFSNVVQGFKETVITGEGSKTSNKVDEVSKNYNLDWGRVTDAYLYTFNAAGGGPEALEDRDDLIRLVTDPKSYVYKGESEITDEQVDITKPEDIEHVQDYVDPESASDNFRDYKDQQLNELLNRYGTLSYSDQDISGVIYAWGNINVNIGSDSTLNLTGGMIAYGGDPQGLPATDQDKGKIQIEARQVGLTMDPDYMSLFIANGQRKLKRTMFSLY